MYSLEGSLDIGLGLIILSSQQINYY
jgi:hypothetical protein